MAQMVSTADNPYNYFTEFDKWYDFDVSHGYNTCQYVARIAKYSTDMNEEEIESAINNAVDEILSFNLSGNYVKVTN